MKLIKLDGNDKHKYMAVFDDGKKTKFGATGYDDYTKSPHDKDQRDRYRARHKKDLSTHDPKRSGYLSYYLLWGDSTSLNTNLAEYKKKFPNI